MFETATRDRMWRIFGAAQVALLVPMAALERRMKATGGGGIIPFEMAGTPERARRTMDTWAEDGRAAARASLLLDYPFLVSYTGLNLAGVAAAADAFERSGLPGLAAARPALTAAGFAAGACDAVENAALLGVLAERDDRLPALARGFARTKFALLGAIWAYAALGLAAHLRSR